MKTLRPSKKGYAVFPLNLLSIFSEIFGKLGTVIGAGAVRLPEEAAVFGAEAAEEAEADDAGLLPYPCS